MVSAPGARFYKEYYSESNAGHIVKKVWNAGRKLGFGHFFLNQQGGAVEDDHVYVIKNRKIPCINIIQQEPDTPHGFGTYWHTLEDNMNNISRETMAAVGQTVLHVLYNE